MTEVQASHEFPGCSKKPRGISTFAPGLHQTGDSRRWLGYKIRRLGEALFVYFTTATGQPKEECCLD